jgi:acetyltransferase-like isoleucine patch superfamily enzyme
VKSVLTLLVALLLPPAAKPFLLRLLGHKVHNSVRIGASVIWRTHLCLDKGSRIRFGNLIMCRQVLFRERASLAWGNVLKGPFKVRLGFVARIGTRNTMTCGPRLAEGQPAPKLWLSEDARITGQHALDLTRSIKLGRHSHLAGRQSQVWTHGYVHARTGYDRARVDGAVFLGNNVYIGAFSCISPGVHVADSITVGSHSSIARSLEKPGVYVSQALRYIDGNPYEARLMLEQDTTDQLDRDVRYKRSGDGSGYR